MSPVLNRSTMAYRDNYDQGKAIPNSVYMVTSRSHQKYNSIVLNTTILYIYASVIKDSSIPKLVVGLGIAGFNEKEHQNVICCTYLLNMLKVSH